MRNSETVATSVGLCSLGCAKNGVDAELMLGLLREAGFEIEPRAEAAEVIVVNTCGFIDEAREESIETILEMARHKDTGRCRRLVVTGCLSQRYRAELLDSIPEIDACLGLDEMDRIADACSGAYVPAPEPAPEPQRLDAAGQPRLRTTPRHYAYLKIADGCDHACGFCVIPAIRGRYRSRPLDDVVAEAHSLVDDGAVELNLVAQDLGPYGGDIGLENGLAKLLRALARLEGLRWLRLLYVYPEGLDPGLVETIAAEPAVVPYLDIPLQHASARVLKSMGRPGDGAKSLEKLDRLRKNIPGLAIRTSLIVGFPTEEKEDFHKLLDFVAAARFEHLGVFTFSHEEGSDSAARFGDRWPAEVKAERRDRVMELQREISLGNHTSLVGTRRECLVDGLHAESELLLSGRLATQAPESDGGVIINDGFAEPGSLVTVEITEAHPYDLVGRITDGRE